MIGTALVFQCYLNYSKKFSISRCFKIFTAVLYSLTMTFSFCNTAKASFLSMRTTLNSTVMEKELAIKLSVQNLGDEDAFNVQPVVNLNNKTVALGSISTVKQGASLAWEDSITFQDANLKTPGSYPVIVTLHYHDANGYSFSAITVSFIEYKTKGLFSNIVAKAGEVNLSGPTKASLHVKNMDKRDKEIRLTFILPKEISVDKDPKEFRLKGGETKEVTFRLSNFSALPKSNYGVYYLMEYEMDGRHFSELTAGKIQIEAERSLSSVVFNQRNLIIISAVFGGLFILFQFNIHKILLGSRGK